MHDKSNFITLCESELRLNHLNGMILNYFIKYEPHIGTQTHNIDRQFHKRTYMRFGFALLPHKLYTYIISLPIKSNS